MPTTDEDVTGAATVSTSGASTNTGETADDLTGAGGTTDGTTGELPPDGCPDGDVVFYEQDDVLAHAGCTDFPGDVTVTYAVTDLSPIAGVRTVAGTLTLGTPVEQVGAAIFENPPELTDLSILAGVTTVTSLSLQDNAALVDLDELAGLVEVTGDVALRNNAALPGLTDLAALQTIGGDLAIVSNPSLSQAGALAWAEPIGVGGVRKIGGNTDDATPPFHPCPWFEDGECDEPFGSGMCVEDGKDCCAPDEC